MKRTTHNKYMLRFDDAYERAGHDWLRSAACSSCLGIVMSEAILNRFRFAAQGMPALGGHRLKEGLQADWAIKRSRVPVLRGLLLLREDLQFGAQPRADKPGRRAGGLGNVPAPRTKLLVVLLHDLAYTVP